MAAVDPAVRLSAQRALLGAIHPEVRMVKVSRNGSIISFVVVAAKPLSDEARDALACAATEIASDFPDCRIDERVEISALSLPKEDVLSNGWVYQRAEINGG
jgi:hypothetical protein